MSWYVAVDVPDEPTTVIGHFTARHRALQVLQRLQIELLNRGDAGGTHVSVHEMIPAENWESAIPWKGYES